MSFKRWSQLVIGIQFTTAVALLFFSFHQVSKFRSLIPGEFPEKVSLLNKSAYVKYIADKTLYYDEVLTQSCRNFAFTGDSIWVKRYNENAYLLEKAIDTVLLRGNETDRGNFKRLSEANLRLIEIEKYAFQERSRGNTQHAISVLDSEEYNSLKKEYAGSISKYVSSKEAEFANLLIGMENLVKIHSE